MRITLKTLPEATAQQVFDQVVAHLLKQGRESMKFGRCMYKHEDLACAAGCLIAEDEYIPEFETLNWRSLINRDWVPQQHGELISRLQKIHDTISPRLWRVRLVALAEDHNLSTAIMNDENAGYVI